MAEWAILEPVPAPGVIPSEPRGVGGDLLTPLRRVRERNRPTLGWDSGVNGVERIGFCL
jgi:hypothetical protein